MQIRKIGGLWFLNVGRYTFMFCRRRADVQHGRKPGWFGNWAAEHERLHDVMAGKVHKPVVIEHE